MSFYECFLEDVTLHVEADISAGEDQFFDHVRGFGSPGHEPEIDVTSVNTEHGDPVLSILSVDQVNDLKDQIREKAKAEAKAAHQERLADRYDNRRHAA